MTDDKLREASAMKTREQVIEAFFKARGFFHVDEHREEYFYDPNNKSRLMPGHVYFFYPMDKDFALFREHVIEVMAERGLKFFVKGNTMYLGEPWPNCDGLYSVKSSAPIIDNQWLLAAILAATLVLEGEKEKPE